MPFKCWRSRSTEDQLRTLQTALRSLTPVIGGWPPNIGSAQEAQEIHTRWEAARALAEQILQATPDSLDGKLAYGELLRMGHNINVPGAAQASVHILREVITADPTNAHAHLSLASLYVTLHPQFAPHAEEHFFAAEALVPPNALPDIYQGLGFACLYQHKFPQAIEHFETYLQLRGNSPHIQEIVAQLRAGQPVQIVTQQERGLT